MKKIKRIKSILITATILAVGFLNPAAILFSHAAYATIILESDDHSWQKTGYHLEEVTRRECSHSDKKAGDVAINGSYLNPDDWYLFWYRENVGNIQGRLYSLPLSKLGLTKQGMKSEQVSDLNGYYDATGVGNDGKFDGSPNGNLTCQLSGAYVTTDGYAGYAYYRHYFSYCPTTEKEYYVGNEHTWYGTTNNVVGTNEQHFAPYFHVLVTYDIVPNNYTIRFNGNGATGGSTANKAMTYDTASALTRNGFVKTGYTFTGWYRPSTGDYYGDGQIVNNLTAANGSIIDLYAIWTPNTYTIRFNGNGATGGSTANKAMTYDTASALTGNGFVKTGYTFTGWYRPSTGDYYGDGQIVNNLTTTNGGIIDLYATWQTNIYTVNFIKNLLPYSTDGELTNWTNSKAVVYGSAYGTLPSPSLYGTRFDGWFTDSAGGSQIAQDSIYSINGNSNLYAHWIDIAPPTIDNQNYYESDIVPYTLTFHTNDIGGSGLAVFELHDGADKSGTLLTANVTINGVNGTLSYDFTEDGEHAYTLVARDNAGNETVNPFTVNCNTMGLTASIYRNLEPHDPIFANGELGYVKINVKGYVEKVVVTFEQSQVDAAAKEGKSLNAEYTLDPQKTDSFDHKFFVPLYGKYDTYDVIVTAYKGEKWLQVTPNYTVYGTILDQFRTRIR